MFQVPLNADTGRTSYGSILALLATILGVLTPTLAPELQLYAQAGIAGLGAVAVKLP
jgi:hypothetical protein